MREPDRLEMLYAKMDEVADNMRRHTSSEVLLLMTKQIDLLQDSVSEVHQLGLSSAKRLDHLEVASSAHSKALDRFNFTVSLFTKLGAGLVGLASVAGTAYALLHP